MDTTAEFAAFKAAGGRDVCFPPSLVGGATLTPVFESICEVLGVTTTPAVGVPGMF